MEINDALRCGIDGDAILFVGAGLSFLSKNKSAGKLPNGPQLTLLLLKDLALDLGHHNLETVSDYYLKTKGVDALWSRLDTSLKVLDVDPRLIDLYRIPWRRIYTTNYDDAAEVSRSKSGHSVSSVCLEDPTSNAGTGSIIHLNGSIRQISPAKLLTGLVLTDYSYAASKFLSSKWFRFFLNDIHSARAIIFVGYSLFDLDIKRALLADESIFKKSFFFIKPDADVLEVASLSEYGAVVDGGIDSLVSKINTISSEYSGSQSYSGFASLLQLRARSYNSFPETAVTNLTQQLVFGKLPERETLLQEFAFDQQPYLVVRDQEEHARRAVRAGRARDVLVVGEIASGKTGTVLSLGGFFVSEGYRVYKASKGLHLVEELRKLAHSEDRVVVIFESYASLIDEIVEFCGRRNKNHRVILTERLAVHELVASSVDKIFGSEPPFECLLGRLSAGEGTQFDALINFCGFWGDRAGMSAIARQRAVSQHFESSLYRLLLEVIKSEKVQADLRVLLEPLKQVKEVQALFVTSFIVNVLDFRFTINDWSMLFSPSWVRQIMREYSVQARNFLLISGDDIFPRSGALSAQILLMFADLETVRECLRSLYSCIFDKRDDNAEFGELKKRLMRYGSIEPLLGADSSGRHILKYYDEIRAFGSTRDNPDYWLQLGIAATIHDELPLAGQAFENAYSRERGKKRPNLTRIDNYFSRFEMRKAIEEDDPTQAFITFERANQRLKRQIILAENRHYPFKTGRSYTDIAAKHFEKWDATQRLKFLTEAKGIREKARQWSASQRDQSPDVQILLREIDTLLLRIS